jgi:phosphatidylserine/phosphatidylglycerophosphate/cardiolipin synthase-like enzyme
MKLIVQPQHGIDPILRTIERAKRTIDICVFRLDRTEIEKALARAVGRGVRVRALNAQPSAARGRKLEERLLAAGVTLARTAGELLRYHGKFMIVDDALHMYAFNFTKRDIGACRSFGIATRDRRVLQDAVRLFEADSTHQPYVPGGSNLVVSPETARETLARFLRGARRELAIYDERIQDPTMIGILRARAEKGVRVRVIGGMKKAGDGIDVRPLEGFRLHARAIVRDGTRAFVGSQSLRTPELDRRREVGLLIGNPGLTRAMMEVFEADWAASARSRDEPEAEAAAAAGG